MRHRGIETKKAAAGRLGEQSQATGYRPDDAAHGWLTPGIRFFRRIAFPAKTAWVASAFPGAVGGTAVHARKQWH